MSTSYSIPTTQKALRILEKGGPWTVAEVEVPKPGPGEVMVRVEAAGLNIIDAYMEATGFFIESYPCTGGFDAAGTVVQLGEGVTNVAVGDKVLHPVYTGDRFAAFQQYLIAHAELACKFPSNMTIDQAAAIPLCLDTAGLALYAPPHAKSGGAGLVAPWEPEGRDKYKNQPILVFGGSSSVGQYTIQLAKLNGFSPIITTASLKNIDYLKSLGATHVVDRNASTDSLASTIAEITKEPLKTVFVAVPTPETQNAGYDLLAAGGVEIVVLPEPKIDEAKLKADTTGKKVYGIFGSSFLPEKRATGVAMYKHLPEYIASGEFKPNKVEVVPGGLAGVHDALKRIANHEVSAVKLVVRPQETA